MILALLLACAAPSPSLTLRADLPAAHATDTVPLARTAWPMVPPQQLSSTEIGAFCAIWAGQATAEETEALWRLFDARKARFGVIEVSGATVSVGDQTLLPLDQGGLVPDNVMGMTVLPALNAALKEALVPVNAVFAACPTGTPAPAELLAVDRRAPYALFGLTLASVLAAGNAPSGIAVADAHPGAEARDPPPSKGGSVQTLLETDGLVRVMPWDSADLRPAAEPLSTLGTRVDGVLQGTPLICAVVLARPKVSWGGAAALSEELYTGGAHWVLFGWWPGQADAIGEISGLPWDARPLRMHWDARIPVIRQDFPGAHSTERDAPCPLEVKVEAEEWSHESW